MHTKQEKIDGLVKRMSLALGPDAAAFVRAVFMRADTVVKEPSKNVKRAAWRFKLNGAKEVSGANKVRILWHVYRVGRLRRR